MNNKIEVYDAITLPNGGIVTMNKQAYEAFTGQGRSNHRGHWTCTIEFEGDNNTDTTRNIVDIETAAVTFNRVETREGNHIELR